MTKDIHPAVRCQKCGHKPEGRNFVIWCISLAGVAGLREMFPDAKADEMNFVLFSTSGIHGTYSTIEDIETSLLNTPDFTAEGYGEHTPMDWNAPKITVIVCHPRLVGFGYGVLTVTLEDIPFLKALRESSWQAVLKIGRAERPKASEPSIMVNGHLLAEGQAMALRVAASCFWDYLHTEESKDLGPIREGYTERIREVLRYMIGMPK